MIAILPVMLPHALIHFEVALALTGISTLASAWRLAGILDAIGHLAAFLAEQIHFESLSNSAV